MASNVQFQKRIIQGELTLEACYLCIYFAHEYSFLWLFNAASVIALPNNPIFHNHIINKYIIPRFPLIAFLFNSHPEKGIMLISSGCFDKRGRELPNDICFLLGLLKFRNTASF